MSWCFGYNNSRQGKVLVIPNGQTDINVICGLKILIRRKELLEKLLRLRCRIEDWTLVHGWKNMDNHREKKNYYDKVVWKQSDWEFVDNMYNAVVNGSGGFGNNYTFNMDTVKTWNRMWRRYKIETRLVYNPNFEPEWEQIQQMDWSEIGDEVTLGDPAMGFKK